MKRYYISWLFILLLCGSCLNESKENYAVTLQLDFPQELNTVKKSGVKIKLMNKSTGLTYTATTDETGKAVCHVEYGFYQAQAQNRYVVNEVTWIVNGRIEHMPLTPEKNGGIDQYTMPLISAVSSPLIIKEMYYGGCKDGNGDSYIKDQYLIIYNNSAKVQYLDSLCMGFVFPMTSNNTSSFVDANGQLLDDLPLSMMVWMIPGNGTTYALQPGEEVVIACNAVNHAARHANSVDLSKADFALWAPDLIKQESPTPGVEPLQKIWMDKGNAYNLVVSGPAMVIFRIQGDAIAYVSDPANIVPDPSKPGSDMRYLLIPGAWIIDGVECVMDQARVNKRLTTSVDAGYIFIEQQYEGLAVIRRQDGEFDGQIIYMDTNNTTEDFEIKSASLRK